MPQGGRKVPFSAKQKKVQLQHKRERKKAHDGAQPANIETERKKAPTESMSLGDVIRINVQPGADGQARSSRVFRYALHFKRETPEELNRRKMRSREPYQVLPEEALETTPDEFFRPGSALDMPQRPPWNRSMSKEALEAREMQYFREYVEGIEKNFSDADLSYFELNLETWRQLWRVLEMSEVILLVADIRHPVLHFPPALFTHVTKRLQKQVILVLNKIDLVPDQLTCAWMDFFQKQFPGLRVLPFASYAGMKVKGKRGKRQGKLKMAFEACKELIAICEDLVGSKVDLSSWRRKIDEEFADGDKGDDDDDDYDDDDDDDKGGPDADELEVAPQDTGFYQEERYKDGVLTLGFVGHPNVGKSSLLNAIMGKKVVSVSRTPGHTKHFQTIFLTPKVRLCDCPGLVFPSLVPKPLQVLSGCFPVAQLREPYSAIQFMAERVPVPQILKLEYPEDCEAWSAHTICEAWAIQRGFLTAKAARPDVYRAANSILRMALDGRTLCLAFYPPGYTKNKDKFEHSPLMAKIARIHAGRKLPTEEDSDRASEKGSSDDDENDDDADDEGDDEDEPVAQANKFALLSAA
ncbi:guanine nucleotide-binding protein-like 1 [Ornithodoros turicata]